MTATGTSSSDEEHDGSSVPRKLRAWLLDDRAEEGNEDAITAGLLPDNGFEFFAAYDGHGGSRVSHACRDRLHYILEKEILDAKRKANNNNDNDNDNDNDNNSGNSVDWERVMPYCNRGVTIPLSSDHKPDRPDEKKRIESAGGKILNWNGSRAPRESLLHRSIVIATNGLWDVVSNEATCELVRKCLTDNRGSRDRVMLPHF
ncbi:hypothetical protein HAX54_040924 [Datura stramonium]|uniref:PPM-type phosphatase domain-containing protein n=1 Tax=Datura stramonium TaxID=4076 RepID=A0ABS8SL31_DATST|nr:hypothetical protein [Datura stramonium]